MNDKFSPTNKIEHALFASNNGDMLLPEFISILLGGELILPSSIEVQANGSISPLFFEKKDQKMMAVFTSLHLLDMYKKNIKHYVVLGAKAVLVQMPANIGLVINPGYTVGCDISADGIKDIVKDFIL